MKFTLKVLAATLAAVALAGSAQAASLNSSGNGSLLVYVWDTNTQSGYVVDSGLTLNSALADAAAGTSVAVNAGGSSVFASDFSAADIAAGDVFFSVIAGNSTAANPIAITASVAAPQWLAGGTVVGQLDTYEDTSIGNLTGTETTLTTLVAGNGNGNLGQSNDGTALNDGEATLLSATGSTAELYEAVSVPNTPQGRGSIPNPETITNLNETITVLADGEIDLKGASVSAVPLPAAAWLFGAGLLGLVGVGRRRKSF